MSHELDWTKQISRRFELDTLYMGNATNHPLEGDLKNQNLGTFYEISPNSLVGHLNPGFCREVSGNFLQLHRIITNSLDILNRTNPNAKAAVIGTALTGFTLAGFDLIEDDGNYRGTNNDPGNDFDFCFVTEGVSHQSFVETLSDAVEGVRLHCGTPGTNDYFHWAKMEPITWVNSEWDRLSPKARITYRRRRGMDEWGKPYNPMELMHVNGSSLEEGMLEALWKYNPCNSNVFGCPTFFVAPNGKHYIWQPVDLYPNASNHVVELNNPAYFTSQKRSIKEVVHVAHFTTAIAPAAAKYFATGKIATLSQDTIDILKETVQRHKGSLNPDQKKAARKRLESSLYRAVLTKNSHQSSWHLEDHAFDNHPGVVNQMSEILDQVGWGEAILGVSVNKYVRNNQLTEVPLKIFG